MCIRRWIKQLIYPSIIDTDRTVFVEVQPYLFTYDNSYPYSEKPYTEPVLEETLFNFAKSAKIDKMYIFDIDWNTYILKFSLESLSIHNQCIKYELKYSTNGETTVYLRDLKYCISDGFHKMTNAGDPIPLQTKKEGVFVRINELDVKVFHM